MEIVYFVKYFVQTNRSICMSDVKKVNFLKCKRTILKLMKVKLTLRSGF